MNLPLAHPRQQETLRHELRKAGVVFEFAVWQWQTSKAPTENDHKAAIANLFDRIIITEYRDNQINLLRHYDNQIAHARTPEKRKALQTLRDQAATYSITLDLSAAHSIELDHRQLIHAETLKPYQSYVVLQEKEWLIRFYHAFQDPPYGLSIDDAARLPLWQRFCQIVGLHAKQKPQILDWLRHQIYRGGTQTYQQHPLSSYFDAGLEWWGVWCLTIYNPYQQTIAAVVASATD